MPVTITTDFKPLASSGFDGGAASSLREFGSVRVILKNSSNVELTTGNGYTEGGKILQNVRFSYAAGVLTVLADDVTWKASGSGISARKAVLSYYESPFNPPYYFTRTIATIDFGETLTAVANSSIGIKWHSDGIAQYTLL